MKTRAVSYSLLALMAGLFLAACGARVDILMGAAGSAEIEFQTTGKEDLFRNLRRKAAAFSGEELSEGDILSEAAIREGFRGREDLKLLTLSKTDAVSVKGKVSVARLEGLALDAEGETTPFFRFSRSEGLSTLSFRVDRSNAARLPELLPGLDPGLLDLLGPPAIFDDDLSVEEYRMNLQPFLGRANMPALDDSSFELRVLPPGKPPARITAHAGGKLEDGRLLVRLPLLELLVLEKPVEFSLSWKEP